MRSHFLIFFLLSLTLYLMIIQLWPDTHFGSAKHPTPGARGALEFWTAQRAYPSTDIPAAAWYRACAEVLDARRREGFSKNLGDAWRPMGPTNIGGRTLALAIDPRNTRVMYAGAASGGLWKSATGGEGSAAWKYVPTGFLSISVNAIALNPSNPDEILIGTGEVYDYRNSIGGHYIRTTRGSYGIGILRSTDAGATWSKSLDWSLNQRTGVMQILYNPLNPKSVYTATSEGTFKSVDGGISWNKILSAEMANAIAIFPGDTSKLLVACGNLQSAPQGYGIYRSTDAGASFSRTTQGLPSSWSGRASLALSASRPGTLFAGISDDFVTKGIYRSSDFGSTWSAMADSDYCTYQGWYSNVLAVHPANGDILYAGGVDLWRSNDGGRSLADLNENYHVDFHCALFNPLHPDTVWFGTDGGICRATIAGAFRAMNGGYQTTQFYAGFSNAPDDSARMMGGLQDNGTVLYTGRTDQWQSIYGGDGCWTAFDPRTSQTLYVEYQYLNMVRYKAGGTKWEGIVTGISTSDPVAFVGPYILLRKSPETLLCGTNRIYRSTNMGSLWSVMNNGAPLSANPVMTIAASRQSTDTVYAATAADGGIPAGFFASFDGGAHWTNRTAGVPDRYIMDIAIHPSNSAILYLAVSGFGSEHLFRSSDAGATWKPSGAGLPDVPTQAVMVDPEIPSVIYAGDDLGMWVSSDEGLSWSDFSQGLPPCTIADIAWSPVNRKLRIATHGNGVWERNPLPRPSAVAEAPPAPGLFLYPVYPNPCRDNGTERVFIRYAATGDAPVRIRLFAPTGAIVGDYGPLDPGAGFGGVPIPMRRLPSGPYFVRVTQGSEARGGKFVWIR